MTIMMSTAEMVKKCQALVGTGDVDERTESFLTSIKDRQTLTEKQRNWLEAIWGKHFGRPEWRPKIDRGGLWNKKD